MLGLTRDFNPRFVRRYLSLADSIGEAVGAYVGDVRGGTFPSEDESY
jgi:3-methyl-2-oxobutanoate hydroxymethyltransferase